MSALCRFTLVVGFLLLMLFTLSGAVYAQGPDGTVPAGTSLDADAFLAAPDVIVDGDVNGDVFAVGENVTVNGNVTGSVFLVANRAAIRGRVGGSVYALAANLNLNETARIDHSVYVAVLSLLTGKGSVVARDLFTVSFGAQFAGNIARTTRAIIGPLEIFRFLMTQAESLKIFSTTWDSAPPSTGVAHALIPQPHSGCRVGVGVAIGATAGIAGNALECFLNPPQAPPAQEEEPQTDTASAVRVWSVNRLREFAVLALIGLILVLAFPRLLHQWSTPIHARPWMTGLIGLLAAINGFLLLFLLLLAVIALGFIFQGLTLSALALLTWTLGLSLTAAAFWLFILFLFYISQVVFANWAALWVLHRFAPQAKLHRVIPMLLGVFVLVLLAVIPVVGAVISLVAALLGMGGIALTWRDRLFSHRPRRTQEVTG